MRALMLHAERERAEAVRVLKYFPRRLKAAQTTGSFPRQSQHRPSPWAELLQPRSLEATGCARAHAELSHSVVSGPLATEALEETVVPRRPAQTIGSPFSHLFTPLFTPFYTFLQFFTPFLHLFTPLQTAPTCPQDAARHKAQAERAAAERAVQRAAAEREACRENIHRRPTLLASLECRVSELVNSDVCPRPMTGGRRRTGRVAG